MTRQGEWGEGKKVAGKKTKEEKRHWRIGLRGSKVLVEVLDTRHLRERRAFGTESGHAERALSDVYGLPWKICFTILLSANNIQGTKGKVFKVRLCDER